MGHSSEEWVVGKHGRHSLVFGPGQQAEEGEHQGSDFPLSELGAEKLESSMLGVGLWK